MVCISVILWAKLASAQLNICKLRLRVLFISLYEILNFLSGRDGRRKQSCQARPGLCSDIFGVRQFGCGNWSLSDLLEEKYAPG